MKQLLEIVGISSTEVLFFDGALEENGNDYPVKLLGVECQAVESWEDNLRKLAAF